MTPARPAAHVPAPQSQLSLAPPAPVSPEWLRGDAHTVPMLPALAQRVIELAADPEVSIHMLSAVVSKDQVLAARVLGLANSAYSSPGRTIGNLTEAIVRLGTVAVRNVVITVGFTSRMQDPTVYGPRGQALVNHALGTAYMARITADHARTDLEEAFLCGLLHDLGKLVILKAAYEHRRRTGAAVPDEELETVLVDHHPAAGAAVMRRWKLPESLDIPVLHHHDYTAAPPPQRQAAVVYFANRLSHRYGFGCERDDTDLLADPVCGVLDVDATWFAATDERAPGLFDVARQILS